jgi:hypothetical protein
VREQVRVKVKIEDWGRQFPTRAKLITWGELPICAGRLLEIGDKETTDKGMDSSSRDQLNSPGEVMSIVPKIFNLDEGFIFNPDNTSNVNTGANEARRDTWMIRSQLRESAEEDIALPFIVILNLSSVVTTARDDSFTLTRTWEKEEESGVNTRELQWSLYTGEIWKQVRLNNKPYPISPRARLES